MPCHFSPMRHSSQSSAGSGHSPDADGRALLLSENSVEQQVFGKLYKGILAPTQEPSALESLMSLVSTARSLRINFDDFGTLTIRERLFRLPYLHRIHTTPFCLAVKKTCDGMKQSSRCKIAAGRRAYRRKEGFTGLCYLGVAETVEPLGVNGVSLGVFYLGQARVRQWEMESQRRMRRSLARYDLHRTPVQKAWDALPLITEAELLRCQRLLRKFVESIRVLIDGAALDVPRISTNPSLPFALRFTRVPARVSRVRSAVEEDFRSPLSISTLAKRFRCNPFYLGRVFRKHTACVRLALRGELHGGGSGGPLWVCQSCTLLASLSAGRWPIAERLRANEAATGKSGIRSASNRRQVPTI